MAFIPKNMLTLPSETCNEAHSTIVINQKKMQCYED